MSEDEVSKLKLELASLQARFVIVEHEAKKEKENVAKEIEKNKGVVREYEFMIESISQEKEQLWKELQAAKAGGGGGSGTDKDSGDKEKPKLHLSTSTSGNALTASTSAGALSPRSPTKFLSPKPGSGKRYSMGVTTQNNLSAKRDLESKMKTLEEENNIRLKSLQEERLQWNEEKDALELHNATLQKQLLTKDKEVGELNRQLDTAKKELQHTQKTLQEHEGAYEKLYAEMDVKEREMKAQVQTAEVAVAAITDEKKAIQNKLTEARIRHDELQLVLDQTKHEVSKLRQQLDICASSINSLTKERDTLKQDMRAEQEKHEQMIKASAKLYEQMAMEEKKRYDEVQEEKRQLEAEVSAKTGELLDAIKLAETLQASIDELKLKVQQVTVERDGAINVHREYVAEQRRAHEEEEKRRRDEEEARAAQAAEEERQRAEEQERRDEDHKKGKDKPEGKESKRKQSNMSAAPSLGVPAAAGGGTKLKAPHPPAIAAAGLKSPRTMASMKSPRGSTSATGAKPPSKKKANGAAAAPSSGEESARSNASAQLRPRADSSLMKQPPGQKVNRKASQPSSPLVAMSLAGTVDDSILMKKAKGSHLPSAGGKGLVKPSTSSSSIKSLSSTHDAGQVNKAVKKKKGGADSEAAQEAARAEEQRRQQEQAEKEELERLEREKREQEERERLERLERIRQLKAEAAQKEEERQRAAEAEAAKEAAERKERLDQIKKRSEELSDRMKKIEEEQKQAAAAAAATAAAAAAEATAAAEAKQRVQAARARSGSLESQVSLSEVDNSFDESANDQWLSSGGGGGGGARQRPSGLPAPSALPSSSAAVSSFLKASSPVVHKPKAQRAAAAVPVTDLPSPDLTKATPVGLQTALSPRAADGRPSTARANSGIKLPNDDAVVHASNGRRSSVDTAGPLSKSQPLHNVFPIDPSVLEQQQHSPAGDKGAVSNSSSAPSLAPGAQKAAAPAAPAAAAAANKSRLKPPGSGIPGPKFGFKG